MSERIKANSTGDSDYVDDAVDPRVQIELERLNTATDDINKLEVDLDEARATFRELLCESTLKIDSLGKKLSVCIEKSRPYYDARFKAKEALAETQKAAIKFERANSQHTAAKEMVYLAEEGLRTEGRSFDHAWQEMLNHATARVNESEHERAISEAEHRRTTVLYHKVEHEVQTLQRELKRAIAKSRPYYETKAYFNHVLEEQKLRVSALEKSVGDAKMTYAGALRNLEKISDEIHRTRRCDGVDNFAKQSKPVDRNAQKSNVTSPGSSITESPDSTDYTSDEYLRLPEKLNANPSSPKSLKTESDSSSEYGLRLSCLNLSSTEPRKYIKRDRPRSISVSTSKQTSDIQNSKSLSTSLSSSATYAVEKTAKSTENNLQNGEEWTEISLNNSPEEVICREESFSEEEEQNIPYKLLPMDLSPEASAKKSVDHSSKSRHGQRKLVTQKSLPAMEKSNEVSIAEDKKAELTRSPSVKRKGKLDGCLATWISRNSVAGEGSAGSSANSSRRQSLDMLWSAQTGERVKEIFNHGIMMFNISGLTERRSGEPKSFDRSKDKPEKLAKSEPKGKKVPSPLEKTMNYLNAEDETSDNESLASVEMLTEDQISSLMMEPDMNQVCQDILGTPLVEVCPLLQQLQQQQ